MKSRRRRRYRTGRPPCRRRPRRAGPRRRPDRTPMASTSSPARASPPPWPTSRHHRRGDQAVCPTRRRPIEYFVTAARNLHAAGERAGVQRMVMVSIIGIDAFVGGYSAAKLAHERADTGRPDPDTDRASCAVPRVRRATGRLGDAGRRRLRAERCAPRWSPHGTSPRCWSTSPRPPEFVRRLAGTAVRSRSPGHARRAWSLLPNCSSPGAATRCRSNP